MLLDMKISSYISYSLVCWASVSATHGYSYGLGVQNPSRSVSPQEQRRRDCNLGLRTAARDGDLGGVKRWLANGAQINDYGPKSGLTALDHATDAGHQNVMDYLRSQGGVSRATISGVSPQEQNRRNCNLGLRTAARDGDLEKVKYWVANGAQINDYGPKSGLTALDHAMEAGHRDVIAYLRSL
jgi:ribosomal protein S16